MKRQRRMSPFTTTARSRTWGLVALPTVTPPHPPHPYCTLYPQEPPAHTTCRSGNGSPGGVILPVPQSGAALSLLPSPEHGCPAPLPGGVWLPGRCWPGRRLMCHMPSAPRGGLPCRLQHIVKAVKQFPCQGFTRIQESLPDAKHPLKTMPLAHPSAAASSRPYIGKSWGIPRPSLGWAPRDALTASA